MAWNDIERYAMMRNDTECDGLILVKNAQYEGEKCKMIWNGIECYWNDVE